MRTLVVFFVNSRTALVPVTTPVGAAIVTVGAVVQDHVDAVAVVVVVVVVDESL